MSFENSAPVTTPGTSGTVLKRIRCPPRHCTNTRSNPPKQRPPTDDADAPHITHTGELSNAKHKQGAGRLPPAQMCQTGSSRGYSTRKKEKKDVPLGGEAST